MMKHFSFVRCTLITVTALTLSVPAYLALAQAQPPARAPVPAPVKATTAATATATGTAPATANAPATATVSDAKIWRQADGHVTYVIVHKLHTTQGDSHQAEVTGIIDNQELKVMARVPIKSFDSGNANRDMHAQEVLEAARFPMAVVKCRLSKFEPKPGTESMDIELQGEVDLHGEKVQLPVKATLKRVDATHVSVSVRIDDTFSAHHIERPSLFFVPVEDSLVLTAELMLTAATVTTP